MAVETAPVKTLSPVELDDRRLAVENAIGTMRIEDLEPDETTRQILTRYSSGEIELVEMNRLLDEYSRTIR
jgi:Antitoxin VbhA